MALINKGASFAAVDVTFKVAKTLDGLSKRLNKIATGFHVASRNLKPEFGAYMQYSIYLEVGHVVMGMISNPAGGKKLGVKSQVLARPHIVPAIKGNRKWIVAQLGREWRNIVTKCYQQLGYDTQKAVARSWVRVLNDKPRIDAAKTEEQGGNCPYEFGFHRRSIRGYPVVRTKAEVSAFQKKQMAARDKAEQRAKKPTSRRYKPSTGNKGVFGG